MDLYVAGALMTDNLVLLARDGDLVAGRLVGRLSGPGSVHSIRQAELESIHVYPAYRGAGIGSRPGRGVPGVGGRARRGPCDGHRVRGQRGGAAPIRAVWLRGPVGDRRPLRLAADP